MVARQMLACTLAISLFPATGIRSAPDEQTRRAPAPAAIPYFTEPSVAPDRPEIAFVSGGDIWTAPLTGGEAHLLIAHPAQDGRPLYSPDGKQLAFTSTRTGNSDIFVYTFASGEVRRLTFDDSNEQLDGWSRDGKWIYFSSNARDISGMNDVYRVSIDGGTPMLVSADRYATEFFAAPSPDGKSVAFSARGTASSQWWRHGHSHLDESEIWLLRDEETPRYERLVAGGSKHLWPMWSHDGKTLYYMCDSSGAENIWAQPVGGNAKQLTQFKNGRVLWPSISWDGKTIVFERDFGIWKFAVASGATNAIPLTRRSAPASQTTEHLSMTSQIQELALSPDGKKVAFVVRGEVFAASAKDGGNAARVTHTAAEESQVAWSPDSKSIVYASDRDGTPHLFQFDFVSDKETQLTSSTQDDSSPYFSPDGKQIAFIREAKEIRVLDLAAKQEKVITTGIFDRPPVGGGKQLTWSPDNKWIAFLSTGTKQFNNAYVVPSAGGEAKPVSFLPNVFAGSILWHPDGTWLLFDTGQRTEGQMLARLDLVPRAPKFREDQFRELFQEPPRKSPTSAEGKAPAASASGGDKEKPATKPVEITFDGIRRRLNPIPVGLNPFSPGISADGKTLLISASVAGQTNLYTYSLDELSRDPAVARQLTSTAEQKGDAQFSPDGKEVYFLGGGRIQISTVESRQVRPLAVTAELDVDFDHEKMEVFEQAWTLQRDNFYDPKFHGVNWTALHDQFAPRIAGARTPDEMRRLLNLMLGELNASHSGASAPGGTFQPSTGRLGLRFDRKEYENNGRLRITEVIALSPAALGGIKSGEYLTAVEGASIGARTNLDQLLAFTIGKRVALSVAALADGSGKREVIVRPINGGAEKQLLYRQWVEERRAYVEKASGGRLGYAHMPDMGGGSLTQFYLDLDAENHSKDGVVVDIRNNNGGFVNVYAIDVLARRPYLGMTLRGQGQAPARSVLGQRSLELPTILVVNQHSLSDAEDFTEGYRSLKLGKVVGEPTAGWIIYTWGAQLIDGTNLRLPRMLITDANGKNMELNPRPVDVPAERAIGETYAGKDSQLDFAVAELLKQIGPKKK